MLFLPDLRFDVAPGERHAFSPAIAGSAKNVGFDPATGRIGGTVLGGDALRAVTGMLARFSQQAAALVDRLLPSYRGRVEPGRTSFRPVEIADARPHGARTTRACTSTAFPASPVQGRRILRVFTNVNPEGRARLWRIGEGFEQVARRFAPLLQPPLAGSGAILRWLRVTKSRRSPYDAMMLQLHDRMKADQAYQTASPQTAFAFPPATTWIAFTDQVSHAAMAGQYQLEQTFLLPVGAMRDEGRAPLRVLERLTGRSLV